MQSPRDREAAVQKANHAIFGKAHPERFHPHRARSVEMGTALPPGSRADAPRLKVDVAFMKFVTSEAEWEREIMNAGDGVLCVVDVYNPLWCALISLSIDVMHSTMCP